MGVFNVDIASTIQVSSDFECQTIDTMKNVEVRCYRPKINLKKRNFLVIIDQLRSLEMLFHMIYSTLKKCDSAIIALFRLYSNNSFLIRLDLNCPDCSSKDIPNYPDHY